MELFKKNVAGKTGFKKTDLGGRNVIDNMLYKLNFLLKTFFICEIIIYLIKF